MDYMVLILWEGNTHPMRVSFFLELFYYCSLKEREKYIAKSTWSCIVNFPLKRSELAPWHSGTDKPGWVVWRLYKTLQHI